MSLIVLLVILLFLFGGGGLTYHRWSGNAPAWGGSILYLLAVIILIIFLVNLIVPGRFGGL